MGSSGTESRLLRLAVAALICLSIGFGTWAHARAEGSKQTTITLDELNDSGASGVAILTAQGDRTLVDLSLSGLSGDHPNHIHAGTCDDPDPDPMYPLTDIVLEDSDDEGNSETTVDVPLQELIDGK